MSTNVAQFDPTKYKETTREQWQAAAQAWDNWGPTLNAWLGPATEVMLDLADAGPGKRVLDVAAGAGDQTIAAAKRVGRDGYVLATDISSNILEFAAASAQRIGLKNIETAVMDGENLRLPADSFDAAISRVGLIYFPDQHKALLGILRVLKPGGKFSTIVYSTPERNQFFSLPISIIRRRADLPPPLPGQPGPFSLGATGALQRALEQAGFVNVQTQLVAAPLRVNSASDCVRFEKESFGALHQMLASLEENGKTAAWAEIADSLRAFETTDGFEGPCELVVAGGTKSG